MERVYVDKDPRYIATAQHETHVIPIYSILYPTCNTVCMAHEIGPALSIGAQSIRHTKQQHFALSPAV